VVKLLCVFYILCLVWGKHFFPPLDIAVVPVVMTAMIIQEAEDSVRGLCLKAADLLLYNCVYQSNSSTERITLRGAL
jgi:hypothetical protein